LRAGAGAWSLLAGGQFNGLDGLGGHDAQDIFPIMMAISDQTVPPDALQQLFVPAKKVGFSIWIK